MRQMGHFFSSLVINEVERRNQGAASYRAETGAFRHITPVFMMNTDARKPRDSLMSCGCAAIDAQY
jgi:hypothetical protein